MLKHNDRTVKVLLLLLVVGVWGLLLRPLFTATPARAQQPNRANAGVETEIVGQVSPAPSVVVVGGSIYVAADGYITRYATNGGQNLIRSESDKLPSRFVYKAPQPATGQGGGFGGGIGPK